MVFDDIPTPNDLASNVFDAIFSRPSTQFLASHRPGRSTPFGKGRRKISVNSWAVKLLFSADARAGQVAGGRRLDVRPYRPAIRRLEPPPLLQPRPPLEGAGGPARR